MLARTYIEVLGLLCDHCRRMVLKYTFSRGFTQETPERRVFHYPGDLNAEVIQVVWTREQSRNGMLDNFSHATAVKGNHGAPLQGSL